MAEQVITNRIIKGEHSDNHPLYQPPDTMRKSRNGVIMDTGDGNYIWQTLKGTKYSFRISNGNNILGWCIVRDRFFIITITADLSYVRLREIGFDNQGGVLFNGIRWQGSNDELNFSLDYPMRRMIGYYENQEIQRIYFTDYYNNPRVINVGYSDPANKNVTIEEKFIEFTPAISNGFGIFKYKSSPGGGFLKSGTYHFAWRFYHKGYYTDWSYISHPVKINPGTVGMTPDSYQEYQGGIADEIASKKIAIQLTDIDDDYDSIQIAAFYSNDLNITEPGVIFYDGDITGTEMDITYNGNENAGVVTIEELIASSIKVERVKDMDVINGWMTLSNVKLREEIDASNFIEATVDIIQKEVILDITGYPNETWTSGNKGLVQSPKASQVGTRQSGYTGIQYMTLTDGDITDGLGITEYYTAGDIFTWPEGFTAGSGTFIPTIALKKYVKPGGGGVIYDSSDYAWNTVYGNLENEFLDWKSTKISGMLAGYPGGETIRLGIIFFDLHGIPFYGRWIKNLDPDTGLGDVTIPERNSETGGIPLIISRDETVTADGTVINQLNGITIGLSISGLDITDMVGKISGFMIVRAPIVRRCIGMGIINKTIEDSNELFSNLYFRNYDNDANYKENIYTFYSPEDVLDLKDFSIQSGDKLVPLQYLEPYNRDNDYGTAALEGIGINDVPATGSNTLVSFYQKFCLPVAGTDGAELNGTLGLEHDILYSTKYEYGDDDLIVDPRNELLLYKQESAEILVSGVLLPRHNVNSKHSILVLDTEDTGPGGTENPVGHFDRTNLEPIALLCKIIRENDNPYGSQQHSDLSNTRYIACGHYQEINDDVLDDIVTGGRYIFNEIEIFGGDSFVSLFDIQKHMMDISATGTYRIAHSIIFPVESRINIGMRKGKHFAKDRSFHSTNNPNGLKWDINDPKLEEFNYNNGYSTVNVQDQYVPLPYNYSTIAEFDSMIRFSLKKTNGEREDSFRKYLANNYIELDTTFGPVNNIRSKFNTLLYWQEDAVGYIPVNERALTQSSMGDPIQLGVGGVFERHDELTDRVGNSHQFGLVESDMGFHWYDAKRKIYLTLTDSLKFSQDSMVKGMNNYFENEIDVNVLDFDNPYKDHGITGGYDPLQKVVFTTFSLPSEENKTIGIDIRNNVFIGEFDMPGVIYMRHNNIMYSIPYRENEVYAHSFGEYLRIYGEYKTALLQIVVKLENFDEVFFDHFKINGDDEFFETIEIETHEGSQSETIQKYQDGQWRYVTRNYIYRNGKWQGTFPKLSGKRAVGSHMIVTFTTTKGLTKFLDMTTFVRKAY
jgi:hypothetical protein